MVTHYIHRGLAKKNFKENTLPGFRYSFKKKYGIETDLHSTKDNQLVCFHDFNIKSKFKLNKNIKDINFSELKRVSKKNKAEIPLLKDLLKASKNKYSLLLEIKPIFSKNILLNLIKLTKKIKLKSKLPHVKFLVLEKKFLSSNSLKIIKKPTFYYTIKSKRLFKKYKDNKNLIFENL